MKKFIFYFFISVLLAGKSYAKVLRVCPKSCAYSRIEAAIKASQSADIIELEPGVYPAVNLLIDHSLSIRGLGSSKSRPILDGQFKGQILTVKNSSEVEIENIQFSRSGLSYLEDLSAIKIVDSSKCLLRNNAFSHNYFSVLVQRSHYCRFEKNNIVGREESSAIAGNGLHFWNSDHMVIKGNYIQNHRDGIYFEFVTDTLVENNISFRNQRYGLHFMFSHQNEFRNNQFKGNGAGVAVMYSRQIVMENNRFSDNLGSAAYGILLKDISASHIKGNLFVDNSIGIFMESSNRNQIHHNRFQNNGYALRIMADSENNILTLNNFLENTFQVTTNSSHSQNTYNRNYWSDYKGLDLNHDHYGDLPYRPVKLSSLLLEQISVSLFLVRSFFLDLIDLAEGLLPDLTPVDLKDSEPLLKEVV